jgi:hypothetical protein
MTFLEQLAMNELTEKYYNLSPSEYNRLRCTVGVDSICTNVIAKYGITNANTISKLLQIEAQFIDEFENFEQRIYNIKLEATSNEEI